MRYSGGACKQVRCCWRGALKQRLLPRDRVPPLSLEIKFQDWLRVLNETHLPHNAAPILCTRVVKAPIPPAFFPAPAGASYIPQRLLKPPIYLPSRSISNCLSAVILSFENRYSPNKNPACSSSHRAEKLFYHLRHKSRLQSPRFGQHGHCR